MGSSRLPGKVLMDLEGQTVLARVIHRLERVARIDQIVVATSIAAADDAIVSECAKHRTPVFRGSEHDVLDRYFGAAQKHAAGAVVRITSDCPLIDPELVDEVIARFTSANVDFASNVITRTYPRGLDTEVFSFRALEKIWAGTHQQHQREHVTLFFYEHRELFSHVSVVGNEDLSAFRWTLDTNEDFCFLKEIYSHFKNDQGFSWRDVLALIDRQPALALINAHVAQKAVWAATPSQS